MTTTSFDKKPLIYSVVYGCTSEVLEDFLARWLNRTDEFAFHPLLMPMMFAEIERLRLIEPLEDMGVDISRRILEMENRLRDDGSVPERDKIAGGDGNRKNTQTRGGQEGTSPSLTEKDCQAIKLWLETSALKDSMKNFLLQLGAMKKHLLKIEQNLGSLPAKTNIDRSNQLCSEYMDERLREIMEEIQSRLQGCETQLGAMMLAIQMV